MNTLKAQSGLTTIKMAVVAVATACLLLALSASGAKAAQGDQFEAQFNHVGLFVGLGALGGLDELVLDPTTTDSDDNLLGPLTIKGTYTDNAGNFTVPKATGLDFPDLNLDIEGVKIEGSLQLAEDGSGKYDESTGDLDLDMKLALILGASEIGDIGLPIPASGALKCEFSPLDISSSTKNGWPHAGEAFGDKANLEEGAVAGAFTYRPAAKSLITENAALCELLGGMLDPVGGIWLGNYAATLTDMPAATGPKPPETKCPEGFTGRYPNCTKIPEPEVCPDGQTGTPPDCKAPATAGKVGKLTATPKKGKVKRGKTIKVKVKVTNSGGKVLKTKIKVKSSNKQVKAPKTISVSVQPGKTVTKTVKVKAAKKAKGKAKITFSAGGKKATATLTVKK